MGRAERRRLERQNKIEDRKEKVLLTRQEIGQMKAEISHTVSSYSVESLMTCFALAEHRIYGFGAKRIGRCLRYVDELMGAIIDDTACMEDYMKALEEETGIVVKCEDER